MSSGHRPEDLVSAAFKAQMTLSLTHAPSIKVVQAHIQVNDTRSFISKCPCHIQTQFHKIIPSSSITVVS